MKKALQRILHVDFVEEAIKQFTLSTATTVMEKLGDAKGSNCTLDRLAKVLDVFLFPELGCIITVRDRVDHEVKVLRHAMLITLLNWGSAKDKAPGDIFELVKKTYDDRVSEKKAQEMFQQYVQRHQQQQHDDRMEDGIVGGCGAF